MILISRRISPRFSTSFWGPRLWDLAEILHLVKILGEFLRSRRESWWGFGPRDSEISPRSWRESRRDFEISPWSRRESRQDFEISPRSRRESRRDFEILRSRRDLGVGVAVHTGGDRLLPKFSCIEKNVTVLGKEDIQVFFVLKEIVTLNYVTHLHAYPLRVLNEGAIAVRSQAELTTFRPLHIATHLHNCWQQWL